MVTMVPGHDSHIYEDRQRTHAPWDIRDRDFCPSYRHSNPSPIAGFHLYPILPIAVFGFVYQRYLCTHGKTDGFSTKRYAFSEVEGLTVN
jgi:hypothetical protein